MPYEQQPVGAVIKQIEQVSERLRVERIEQREAELQRRYGELIALLQKPENDLPLSLISKDHAPVTLVKKWTFWTGPIREKRVYICELHFANQGRVHLAIQGLSVLPPKEIAFLSRRFTWQNGQDRSDGRELKMPYTVNEQPQLDLPQAPNCRALADVLYALNCPPLHGVEEQLCKQLQALLAKLNADLTTRRD